VIPSRGSVLTLEAVEQLGVADVLVGAVAEPLVVALPPGVHLSIFGERHGELAAAAHLHHVQVLQLLHQLGGLAAVAAPPAQLPVVPVPPGPDLA